MKVEFWGTSTNPDGFQLYIYFTKPESGPADGYCYVNYYGFGSVNAALDFGSEASPVIISSAGTTDPNTGVAPFNTNVYSWYNLECMYGFRFDQGIFIEVNYATLTNLIWTVETDGGDDSHSIIQAAAACVAPVFMI